MYIAGLRFFTEDAFYDVLREQRVDDVVKQSRLNIVLVHVVRPLNNTMIVLEIYSVC